MVPAGAMQIWPKSARLRAVATESYEIHSEPHGPHWIAWVTRDGAGTPHRAVILVAETRELAEARARAWAAQTAY